MVTGSISGALNLLFCFVAGTSVLTTLCKNAIEDIKVGYTVPCVDHITGEASEKKVISTSVNKVNRLVELAIDGEIVKVNWMKNHPSASAGEFINKLNSIYASSNMVQRFGKVVFKNAIL